MKKNHSAKSILTVCMALAAALVLAGTAIADPGDGRGKRRGGGYGYGSGYGCDGEGYGYNQRGYGRRQFDQNLSEEQIEKLNQARETFYEDTRDLRMDIRQKQLALQAEFAKKTPDANAALEMQKEISALKGQMAEKRLMHRLEMKKINPYLSFDGRGKGKGGKRGGTYARGPQRQ